MKFPGFSLPDGAYLPPELIYLIPHISGGSLKVIIAIIYHELQVGGGEPPNLADIEKYTGLSKRQAIRTLTELIEEGIVGRQMIGQSYVYFPTIRAYDKMSYLSRKMSQVLPEMSEVESESDRELIDLNLKDSLSDSLNSTTTSDKISLLKKLRACGVYLKTAQAIVAENTPEEIEQQLEYYRYALKANMAQGPGWLVLALKEKWPAPLGYEPELTPEEKRKREADRWRGEFF